MLHAPTLHPHPTAFAAETGARVGHSLKCGGLPGMALGRSPHPIDRSVSR